MLLFRNVNDYENNLFIDNINITSAVLGCTDPNATNYNPQATIDDSSCIYCIYGCTDSAATNYNSAATCDDGSCIIQLHVTIQSQQVFMLMILSILELRFTGII